MKKYLVSMFLPFIIGCSDMAIKDNFYGNYFLVANDVGEDLNLCYHEKADGPGYYTLVDATVYAVGFNRNYVIVKQHPRKFPNIPNKTVVNYYIIRTKIKYNWRSKNYLIGPLTQNQFISKVKELNLAKVQFTTIYHDLE